jgi:hypothetical protein
MVKTKKMNTKKVPIRRIALYFDKMPVPQKFQFARSVVIAMTGNAHFPNPSPGLAVITGDANNLEVAHIAAQTHAKGTSAQMQALVKVLHLSMQALAHYVENVANADPNNAEAIIKSSGMQIRKTPVHKPRILEAISNAKGQVTLTCRTTVGASYKWDITTGDPTVEANWKVFVVVKQSRTIQNGLLNSTIYHFRQWTIGIKGMGPVSQVVSATVI